MTPPPYLSGGRGRNAQLHVAVRDVGLAVVEARRLHHLSPHGRVRAVTAQNQVRVRLHLLTVTDVTRASHERHTSVTRASHERQLRRRNGKITEWFCTYNCGAKNNIFLQNTEMV